MAPGRTTLNGSQQQNQTAENQQCKEQPGGMDFLKQLNLHANMTPSVNEVPNEGSTSTNDKAPHQPQAVVNMNLFHNVHQVNYAHGSNQPSFNQNANGQDQNNETTKISSLSHLHTLLSQNDFHLSIGGKNYKLQLPEAELDLLQNQSQAKAAPVIKMPDVVLSPPQKANVNISLSQFKLPDSNNSSLQEPSPSFKPNIEINLTKFQPPGSNFLKPPKPPLAEPIAKNQASIDPYQPVETPVIKIGNIFGDQPKMPNLPFLNQFLSGSGGTEQQQPELAKQTLSKLIAEMDEQQMPKNECDSKAIREISQTAKSNAKRQNTDELTKYLERLSKMDAGEQKQKQTLLTADEKRKYYTKSKAKSHIRDLQDQRYEENQQLRQLVSKTQPHQQQPLNWAGTEKEEQPLHVAFLYASPLCIKERDGRYTSVDALNFQEESQAIQNAAQESNVRVRFMQAVATKDNFTEMLSRKPRALHISCHGLQKRNDDFLLLEMKGGEGELVSKRQIGEMLVKYSVQLDLVFVAACKSKFVGSMFQKLGVKHVICVREGAEILDDAVLYFTNRFYKNIFNGETVCAAFKIAQTEVEVQCSLGQANMFKMLLEEELVEIESLGLKRAKQHICQQFGPLQQGTCFEDLTDRADIRRFPQSIKNLIGRQFDLIKLAQEIQTNEKRLTCVLGVPGIGKSCLVRSLIHFFDVRKQFLGGVVMIQAKGVENPDMLIKIFIKALLLDSNSVDENKKAAIRQTVKNQPGALINIILEYLQDKEKISNQKGGIYGSRSRKFLLVIDNAEELVIKNANGFKDFISTLISKCSVLQIVVTSRRWKIMNDIPQQTFEQLRELRPPQDIDLFFDVTGEIDSNEIYELLREDENYNVGTLNLQKAKLVESWQDIESTPAAKEELLYKLNKYDYRCSVLPQHEFFKQMNGNPYSINLIACLRANPLNQKSLSDLNQMIKSEQIQKILAEENINENAFANNNSLRVAQEITLLQLQNKNPSAHHLFFFLGLLPGGVTQSQLSQIWSSEQNVEIGLLEKFGFLEGEKDFKIVLKPFSISYALEAIDEETKDKFLTKIVDFYTVQLKEIYQAFDRQEIKNEKSANAQENENKRQNQDMIFMMTEIRNIQACLSSYLSTSQDDQQAQVFADEIDEDRDDLDDSESSIISDFRDDSYSPMAGVKDPTFDIFNATAESIKKKKTMEEAKEPAFAVENIKKKNTVLESVKKSCKKRIQIEVGNFEKPDLFKSKDQEPVENPLQIMQQAQKFGSRDSGATSEANDLLQVPLAKNKSRHKQQQAAPVEQISSLSFQDNTMQMSFGDINQDGQPQNMLPLLFTQKCSDQSEGKQSATFKPRSTGTMSQINSPVLSGNGRLNATSKKFQFDPDQARPRSQSNHSSKDKSMIGSESYMSHSLSDDDKPRITSGALKLSNSSGRSSQTPSAPNITLGQLAQLSSRSNQQSNRSGNQNTNRTNSSFGSNGNLFLHSKTQKLDFTSSHIQQQQPQKEQAFQKSATQFINDDLGKKSFAMVQDELKNVWMQSDFKIKKKVKLYQCKIQQTGDLYEIQRKWQFALYCLSILYLYNDFNTGITICETALRNAQEESKSSIKEESKLSFLFHANCLRLHALFQEQSFLHDEISGLVEEKELDQSIKEAIKYVQKALGLFSQTENDPVQPSVHGIALCNFHLGLLYSKYSSRLRATREPDASSFGATFMQGIGTEGRLIMDQTDCKRIAIDYFEKAFVNYQKLNHLVGMYQSKHETAQLYADEKILNDDKQVDALSEYSKYEYEYRMYPHSGNEKYCNYVPRVDSTTSLLVEIVMTNKSQDFFRKEQRRKRPSSQKSIRTFLQESNLETNMSNQYNNQKRRQNLLDFSQTMDFQHESQLAQMIQPPKKGIDFGDLLQVPSATLTNQRMAEPRGKARRTSSSSIGRHSPCMSDAHKNTPVILKKQHILLAKTNNFDSPNSAVTGKHETEANTSETKKKLLIVKKKNIFNQTITPHSRNTLNSKSACATYQPEKIRKDQL